MKESGAKPKVTLELIQLVNRMGHIRREMKELETEESVLRDQILAVLSTWPRDIFPIRMGHFEVRLGERRGRVDVIEAAEVLRQHHLEENLPQEATVRSERTITFLSCQIRELPMPEETRTKLGEAYEAAIDWHPLISNDILMAFHENLQLSDDEYKSCFKDGKPITWTLAVR